MSPPPRDDFEDRELCPDGACIGVIGGDGRCKECGARGTGAKPRTADEDAEADDDEDDEWDDDDDEGEGEGEDDDDGEWDEDEDDEDDEAEGRALCVDDACIGLIGPDGVCRECGKPGPRTSLDPRNRGLRSTDDVQDELDEHIQASTIPRADPDFDDRQLCADDTCIGVLGRDGRCRECGKRA